MKVLLVTPEYPPDVGGGILRYIRDLATALKFEGCEISVMKGSAFTHGGPAYVQDGVSVDVLQSTRFEEWMVRFAHFGMHPELRRHLAAAFALHEQAKAGFGYDAVEVTDWGMLFLPWVLRSEARVLVQMHGSCGQIATHEPVAGKEVEGALALLLERAALADVARVSTYSQSNANWWQSILARPVAYVPPPLTPPSVPPATAPDSNHWLAVARIQLWKGPHIACQSWQMLGESAPNLHWIGRDTSHGETGLSTDAWPSQVFANTWRHQVLPIGQMPAGEVYDRMASAKAILVPSLWDTFNLVSAEAMALGKVVVVSDGAGAAGLIQHGENGFVFPKGDARALASLVRDVDRLSQSELYGIGQRAAVTIRESLDPAAHARMKLKMLREQGLPANDRTSWLSTALFPVRDASPVKFLDALPLKDLATYVLRRVRTKYLGRRS